MDKQERRSVSARRVAIETLVEMCGRDVRVAPAFEAESVNVSGRGMQVRTGYLPEVGSTLVCRFSYRGREVIVEGVVAWRRDDIRGGEFGLRFTALDSGSVDVLRELAGLEPEPPASAPEPSGASKPQPGSALNQSGSRVRLHIDGLGSPMRARVREGGKRRVHVGSNLEFLAVGRHLELENLDQDLRRSARIEAVEVLIDPQTQIPQLVVALHYDDVDDTPEPAVIDASPQHEAAAVLQPFGIDATCMSPGINFDEGETTGDQPSEAEIDQHGADEDSGADEQVLQQAEAFGGRLGTAVAAVARQAGAVLARVGSTTTTGVRSAAQAAGAKMKEVALRRAVHKQPRRATTQSAQGPFSVQAGRFRLPGTATVPLRRQGAGQQPAAGPGPDASRPRRRRKVAAAAAGVALVATVAAVAMYEPAAPPGAQQPAAAAVRVSVGDDGTQAQQQDSPVPNGPVPRAAKVKRLAEPKPAPTGIVADVPLFGPTALATMEPAPLGPPPVQEDAQPPAAFKAKPADETFADAPQEAPRTAPEDVKPWGRGRMHLPIIHRLRLDAPGAAIDGAMHPTGFSVVIPGRKVMESAQAITKRDKRIARVQIRNSGSGGEVSFKFRDGVPAYRVRLRKDFVEFLISSPEEKK
jgi:hypothetical protein